MESWDVMTQPFVCISGNATQPILSRTSITRWTACIKDEPFLPEGE